MVVEMIARGVDIDVIELAVATAEQALSANVSGGIPVDISAEKRRAYDRERKRKLRGIPVESGGIPRSSESAPLSKEERKKESKRETTRGSRLPDGWRPTPQDWVIACELIGEPRARSELEKFTDHWKQQPGGKGVKLDWAAAWRNWVRRAAEYGGKNGTPAKRGIIQAADDLRRKIASFDGPAGRDIELRDTARSPIAGLLPDR